MKINLQGKNALVGGSTQGLGKAIALQLAQCGANITLMARNEEKLQQVLNTLNTEFNQQHKYLVVDFYDFYSYQDILTNYFNHNTIEILVNNTNGPKGGTVLEKNTTDYQEAFDLLFKTTQFTTSLALESMQEKEYGRIINATSISVKEPLNHLALSNTIRAAVTTWAKSLANIVAHKGITVNNILTGIFDTERIKELNQLQAQNRNITTEQVLKELENSIPMKRIGKPEEFAYLVTFLASEYASYITGTNITIDGGLIKSL